MGSQIEVYGPNKKLMGRLPIDPRLIRGSRYHFRIDDGSENDEELMAGFYGHPPVHMPSIMVELEVSTRTVEVSELDLHAARAGSPPRILEQVPDYAEEFRVAVTMATRFVWKTLVCPDVEVAELIFEDEGFIADGEPCQASRSEDAWWRHHDAMAGPLVPVMPAASAKTTALLKDMEKLLKDAKMSSIGLPESYFGTPMVPMPEASTKGGSWIRQASFGMGVMKPAALIDPKGI